MNQLRQVFEGKERVREPGLLIQEKQKQGGEGARGRVECRGAVGLVGGEGGL